MNLSLIKEPIQALKSLLIVVSVSTALFSCQPAENKDAVNETTPPTETQAGADTTQKRPAPDFFIIPPELADKRVWICENGTSDIFHTQHDCPVLAQCNETDGTFKNVTLTRAIEAYGRYNCETCSKDLDHIFDKDMVR
ncbi:hypothetical protein ACFSKU_13965 [Pontibacter silvestris]|uniref:Uncharacterized protein n=1 Tax=Pontibacter silvestris TaxID=2305183 RepID=A0ABW4WZ39_9BACT|nr:hypothetical protein [Pontibacter silvestris]MCC9135445.1 hypothetical protein [Pontibacter silvestris]